MLEMLAKNLLWMNDGTGDKNVTRLRYHIYVHTMGFTISQLSHVWFIAVKPNAECGSNL